MQNLNFKTAFQKNNIPIFLSSDENYAPYLSVTIRSIFNHRNKNVNYDIIVLHTSISDVKKNKIISSCSDKNFSIRFINIEKFLKTDAEKIKYTCCHFSVAMYYRIFISDIFKCYDKAIYLDCDLIVQKDLSEFFNIDIEKFVLGAILDFGVIQFNNTFIPKEYCENILKISNENYFNSGVLLINCKKFREEKIKEKCLTTLHRIKTPIAPDQDILNVSCNKKVKFLPFKYNFEWSPPIHNKNYINTIPSIHHQDFLEAEKNPIIIHYTGDKPWKFPHFCYANIWWHYARQTPFYEEILLKMVIDKEIFIHISHRLECRFKYLKYKFLKPFMFGKKRKKYKEKKKKYKSILKEIKSFLK